MSVLWECDECKGPASWTIDDEGVPWYHCTNMCEGFIVNQEVLDFVPTMWYLDRPCSVSASEDRGQSDAHN